MADIKLVPKYLGNNIMMFKEHAIVNASERYDFPGYIHLSDRISLDHAFRGSHLWRIRGRVSYRQSVKVSMTMCFHELNDKGFYLEKKGSS